MNRPKSNDGEKKRKKSYIASNLAKVLLVLILMAVFFVVGTMIGYGVLGGGNSFDVFKSTTWEHLFSFF
ncbi:DNA-directed RNA polymerase subunit beta [Pilibacter termitis]|nr:DNA-directed RNA polymerase subunit beta [Pilibacter termitis]